MQDAHIRVAALSIEPGGWQAPEWLLGSHAAQPAAAAEASTRSSSSSSSGDSSSADGEEAHADAYSEPSSGSDAEQRGAKSGALVPAAGPQPKGLPPVALQPPPGQEPDEAASLGFPVQPQEPEQEQGAGDSAQERTEREERRKAAALRRLDAILGGKANVSKARQKLLQVCIYSRSLQHGTTLHGSLILLLHMCTCMQLPPCMPMSGRRLRWVASPDQELAEHRSKVDAAAAEAAAEAEADEAPGEAQQPVLQLPQPEQAQSKQQRAPAPADHVRSSGAGAQQNGYGGDFGAEFQELEGSPNPVFVRRQQAQDAGDLMALSVLACTCLSHVCMGVGSVSMFALV
jgi:hypothetical protein